MRLICRVALFLSAAIPALISPCRAGTDAWTSLGPTGGYAQSLAFDSSNPSTSYAGFQFGGVYKTTNGGNSWAVSLADTDIWEVYCLATHPTDFSIVFAGTDKSMYRSTNSGNTWSPSGPLGIKGIAFSLATPSTMYVGGEQGVFKSTNNGANWTLTAYNPLITHVTALAVHPVDTAILYAGTEEGLFRSMDSGANWTAIETGLTSTYVSSLAVDTDNPSTVYVCVLSGLFKSTDGGDTWFRPSTVWQVNDAETVHTHPSLPDTVFIRGGYHTYTIWKSTDGGTTWQSGGLQDKAECFTLAPSDPLNLMAGTNGVSRSTNGGASWTRGDTGLNAHLVYDLAMNPAQQDSFYACALGGIYKTTDGGNSWTIPDYGPNGCMVLSLAPSQPATLYAATAGGICAKTTDGGANWVGLNTGITHDIVCAAIHPTIPTTVYLGTIWSSIRASTDGGSSWQTLNSGLNSTIVNDIGIVTAEPNTLYAATNAGVCKSTNSGQQWTALAGGLPAQAFKVIQTVPGSTGAVYAATTASVYRTTNGGTNWSLVNPGQSFSAITCMAVSPVHPQTVLVGSTSGVYRTTNGGSSWQQINEGLLLHDVRAIKFDPFDPSSVVIGVVGGSVWKRTWEEVVPPPDRDELIALYNATGGDQWVNRDGWKTPPLHTDGFAMPGTEGGWFGVTVSGGRVTALALHANRLSGSLPAAIGGLDQLQSLDMGANCVTGWVPSSMAGLSHLSSLDLGYNGLQATGGALRSFLAARDPDWETTQTIPPEGLQVNPVDEHRLSLSWTPVAYVQDPGGYRVLAGASSAGPYSLALTVEGKQIATCEISDLPAGQTQYYRVQAYTAPHALNPFEVQSEGSDPVIGTTICFPVIITSPPAGKSWVSPQVRVTLQVEASGSEPLGYQWYQGAAPDTSAPVAFSNRSRFTTPSLTQSAQYWVRVMNPCGQADSPTAVITVVPGCENPAAPILHAPGSARPGVAYAIYWSPTSAMGRYEWEESTAPDFTGAVSQETDGTGVIVLHAPDVETAYYSRVRAIQDCGAERFRSTWSPARVTLIGPETTDAGDLNGDGTVDESDALLLAHLLAENIPSSAPADLDGDGRTTALDLQLLELRLIGLF